MSLLFHLGAYSCLGDVSRLGDGCGALRLGGVGVNRELRAREGGGESMGGCLRVGVDGAAVLRYECGGGVDRGFVLCRSMSKYFSPVVSLSVPNSRGRVLDIPKL